MPAINPRAAAAESESTPDFEQEQAGARLGGQVLTWMFLAQVAGAFLYELLQCWFPPYLQPAFLRNPGENWEGETLLNITVFAVLGFVLFCALFFAAVVRGRSLAATLVVMLLSAAAMVLTVISDVQMTNYVIRERGMKVGHTFSFLLPGLNAPP
jgi:hypothetical protein